MTTEQKNVVKEKTMKAKKTKKEVPEDFKPLEWDGVVMKEDKVYYIIRSRAEIPGITALDVAEKPNEVIEAKFLSYDPKEGYAFDDGRYLRQQIYLCVPRDERIDYIYPHTPAGKKSALAKVAEWTDRHTELIAGARHVDPSEAERVAVEANGRAELEVMMIALGGTPKELVNAGQARRRKVDAVLKKRLAWIENRGKKPTNEKK